MSTRADRELRDQELARKHVQAINYICALYAEHKKARRVDYAEHGARKKLVKQAIKKIDIKDNFDAHQTILNRISTSRQRPAFVNCDKTVLKV